MRERGVRLHQHSSAFTEGSGGQRAIFREILHQQIAAVACDALELVKGACATGHVLSADEMYPGLAVDPHSVHGSAPA